jgi:hypothetical protein
VPIPASSASSVRIGRRTRLSLLFARGCGSSLLGAMVPLFSSYREAYGTLGVRELQQKSGAAMRPVTFCHVDHGPWLAMAGVIWSSTTAIRLSDDLCVASAPFTPWD